MSVASHFPTPGARPRGGIDPWLEALSHERVGGSRLDTYDCLVPKRTNLFQEVVEIIHGHMAEDATVEASAMLRDGRTGYDREVDVVIRSRSAGYEIVVSVEAVGRSRKATVEWVEQVVRKHQHLPTNKLVLVAERGFSEQARAVAESEGAVALAPEDLTGDDPAGRVVSTIRSLWPKVVTFNPEEFGVNFDDADAPKEGWPSESPPVYADDSTLLAETLAEYVVTEYRESFPELMSQIGLADMTSDAVREWVFTLENGHVMLNGVRRRVCLLNEDGHLYSLKRITAKGKAVIRVSEIPLTHGRLGQVEVLFSYGEGKVAGRDTLVVLSEPEGEERGKLTLRIRPEK